MHTSEVWEEGIDLRSAIVSPRKFMGV
jgi:hypothetical protein